jgi:hypothetical protein
MKCSMRNFRKFSATVKIITRFFLAFVMRMSYNGKTQLSAVSYLAVIIAAVIFLARKVVMI